MHKIRDVLRLTAAGLSSRKIAASLSVGATTVVDCLYRARAVGLVWPLPDELTDEVLAARLYAVPGQTKPRPVSGLRPLPDWPTVHQELRRKGVTLNLLWQEHRAVHPEGHGYSQFCDLYRVWNGRLSLTMRQVHVAGERLFVDYAGTTLSIVDGNTGEVLTCQLFVAALGASSYTYAEATMTQTLPDWIGSHTRAFAFFGGVTALLVSDNLKSGITKACFHEPAVNRAYAGMAGHYDTAVVPARPYKPRDKAKVEVAVQLATRWIIAKLRNAKFFTLGDLNEAVRDCVLQLNTRVTRHLGTSRQALFESLDQPVLKPLPVEPYVYAEWKECRAGLDYHVEVEKHYYSVPCQHARQKFWVRITARTVEVFHRGHRIAAHVRSSSYGTHASGMTRRHTTLREHMPLNHQRYGDWTPERIQRKADETGPSTSALIEVILRSKTHPEQGFRACLGIIRHAKAYGPERLEAACGRALEIGAHSYSSVTSILKTNLDRQRPAQPNNGGTDGPAIVHDNIRGPHYFH